MTPASPPAVRRVLPNEDDIQQVARLLQTNQSDNGGALTGNFPVDRVRQMVAQPSPVIGAWLDGRLLGVVFTAQVSAADLVPVLAAMRAAWPGRPDDYLYGPVCIDAAARGQGLLPTLYAELKRQLPGRAAVLFITADNIASQRAHQRLGMREVASFDWNGGRCDVYTDAPPVRPGRLRR